MAIPVLASSSSFHDTGNNATRTINKPSGTASGDWLVLCVGIDSAGTITTPSGFTLVDSFSEPMGSGTIYVFKRKADGSEGSTFTIDSSSEYATGIMVRITGADSTDCIDVVSRAMGEIDARGKVRFGECWAGYTNNLLLFFSMLDGGSSSFTAAPSGATLIVSEAGGSSGNMMAGWQKDQAAQGYTGFLFASTGATTEQFASFLIVIRSNSGAISYPAYPVRRTHDFYRVAAATALTYLKPFGTVSGNLLLMIQQSDTNVLTPDSDFTSVQSTNNGAVTYHQVYYRIAGGSETSTYDGTSATSGAKMGSLLRLENTDPTTPINTSSVATGTNASPAGGTITTTVNDCLLISSYSADDDDAANDTNYPSGYTGLFNEISLESGDASFGIATLEQSGAGATGTVTWTNGMAAVEEWVAIMTAIAPVASAPSNVPESSQVIFIM